jgi:AraC-like DNA-binding protein
MPKTSSHRGPEYSSTIDPLLKLCRRLKAPQDYWKGREYGLPLLPQNVLVFARGSGKELNLGDSFRTQHHRYVLITAVQGEGHVGIDARIHPLRAGQSLLIHPFQVHWYEGLNHSAAFRWVFVTFEHEADERLERLRGLGGLEAAENSALLLRFLSAWQDAASQELVPLRLAEWLFLLGKAAQRKQRSPSSRPPISPGAELVVKINRLVFRHREDELSLAQVAKHVGMSPSLLRLRFREIAGRSVGKYIRELKLQHACELLQGSRLSVSEIASRCGYGSVFSFSRAFRRTYRMAPGKYRKKAVRPRA